ncbi:MAG: hypothetical protein ABIT83_18865 [Massilia sp.]
MTSPFDILLEPTEKKAAHPAAVGLVDRAGRYRIGPPTRPAIRHDNGHLDMYPPRAPTASDRAQLVRWFAMLEGSEALCNAQTGKYLAACNHEDLSDANAAYRHFLSGNGKDRTINYERYLQGDPSGPDVIKNVLADFQTQAEIIGKDRLRFAVTSDAYTVGNGGIAPYPATSNWQKAIGAHFLWVSANVVASVDKGKIVYDADLVFHVEDRYNFNPGAADVATGIPDSANGQFEISGLAKQYTNYATVQRHTRWVEGAAKAAQTSNAGTSRQRKPSDNRRLRNRV